MGLESWSETLVSGKMKLPFIWKSAFNGLPADSDNDKQSLLVHTR